MNQTLSLLKLAAKFCDKKDIREYIKHVQIIEDEYNNSYNIFASNGHIAIKITCMDNFRYNKLPSQLSCESIEQACKVNLLTLLASGEHEIKFPDFNKCFSMPIATELKSAKFDIKYLSRIFKALEDFCKERKIKGDVLFSPLQALNSNILSSVFYPGTDDELKIEIAIMPLKQ